VGIHQGDIIVDGDDIFGDGVNVAARLEGLAEPGNICVSARVQEDAQGKLEIGFENAGDQQLKNIVRPVRVYRVRLSGAAEGQQPALPLPDKPSIAVLPFQNMSGDPDQEYFADGMVEDIITALSRFKQLFVIARNSSFTYKGHAVDVKRVGRELGVRYLLEGSVRKAANRVRITAQLVDATTGSHLWADRFDGVLKGIFDLQDSVTARVVGAIIPKLEQAEIERAKHNPTQFLDAYDYYLRAIAIPFGISKEANDEALRLYHKALELDPEFALASARAAYCYVFRKMNRWIGDPKQEIIEAAQLVRNAVDIGRDDAVALSSAGAVLAYVLGDLDNGAAFVNRALSLNPNLAMAWGVSGWMNVCLGNHETAIRHAARAMRLSPLDPRLWQWAWNTALGHFFAGRYDKATSWAESALRDQPNHAGTIRLIAASCALAGRVEEAQKAIARLRQLDPTLCVSNLKDVTAPFHRPQDLARFEEGLRKAGLPE
jgi:TolB-like protein